MFFSNRGLRLITSSISRLCNSFAKRILTILRKQSSEEPSPRNTDLDDGATKRLNSPKTTWQTVSLNHRAVSEIITLGESISTPDSELESAELGIRNHFGNWELPQRVTRYSISAAVPRARTLRQEYPYLRSEWLDRHH